jgi:hypothetical protein
VCSYDLKFGLRGLQFGNWLSNEDKYNYALALYAAFYDMNKVLRFKTSNLGLSEHLAIGFGSRGVPNSLAHYEGDNFVINITRYSRNDRLLIPMSKEKRFLNTGGAGSFAHEYAHFLDNAFGLWSDQIRMSNWLTGDPRSTSKKRINYDRRKNPIRAQLEDVFESMLWTKSGKPSAFQHRILEETPYYNYKTEMFARLFEVYISFKLREKGIYNEFLVKRKYNRPVYLTTSEIRALIPKIDKLIELMRDRS